MKKYPYPMRIYANISHNPATVDTRVIHNIPLSLFADAHLIRTTAIWGESIILIMPPGIGTVRCSWLNGDSSTMIISDLAVAEAYRGRGVARALIQRAEKIATLSASPTMLLSVNPDSFMRQAYMRYGFRPTGERDENGLDIMTKETPAFKIWPVQFPNITYGTNLRALSKGARIIVKTVSGEVVRGAYQGLVDSLSYHDKAIMILDDDGLITHVEFSDIRKDHKPTNFYKK